MQSAVSGKRYFLRQSGRITGPYPMLKLTAMYHRGDLKCEDMCSEDKIRWHYINVLFPALSPSAPIAIEESPAPAAPAPPAPVIEVLPELPPEPESLPPVADDKVPADNKPLPIPPRVQDLPQAVGQSPFAEWLADIGRTIALVWDFGEILQMHGRRAGRFLGIAFCIHALLALVIVLTFGKYYSSRFHSFFSPLMGLSLLVMILGVACLIGWSAARRNVTADEKSPAADWRICAAGFCVNYGILACCVLALTHGREVLWVQTLLVFIDSCILCSWIMQLRDFLTENGRNWEVPAVCSVLILNPVLAVLIYGFTILI